MLWSSHCHGPFRNVKPIQMLQKLQNDLTSLLIQSNSFTIFFLSLSLNLICPTQFIILRYVLIKFDKVLIYLSIFLINS